jgi:hypothetical protein
MAMAASSRLLWASRAAAYLRISAFPRAFSTGTCISLSLLPVVATLRPLFPVPRRTCWDHGSTVSEWRDPDVCFHPKARFGELVLIFFLTFIPMVIWP